MKRLFHIIPLKASIYSRVLACQRARRQHHSLFNVPFTEKSAILRAEQPDFGLVGFQNFSFCVVALNAILDQCRDQLTIRVVIQVTDNPINLYAPDLGEVEGIDI
jgi:hypothetical protein